MVRLVVRPPAPPCAARAAEPQRDSGVRVGWKETVAARLSTRTAAASEILLVLALTVGHRVLRIIPVDETLPILALGWVSLWLRGTGWKGVGLAWPARRRRAIAFGAAGGVFLQVLSEYVTEPVIAALTGQVQDLSDFQPLVGNLRLALLYFGVVWAWAAFGEELTYRGYVLNRAADLGGRTSLAWAMGLLVVSGLFGLGHSYQGLAGVIGSTVSGLLFGALYFASGRNLWACIIAHGMSDTIAIVLIFFGCL
jgi:uncharacterized protein